MSIAEKFVTMEYGPAPEDPKDALGWLDGHKRRFGHFINGEWRDPVEGVFFESNDPATGEKIASVAQGSAADISAGVQAARNALPAWQALSGPLLPETRTGGTPWFLGRHSHALPDRIFLLK